MTRRLKYFAIYMAGFVLFVTTVVYAFGIEVGGSIRVSLWLGLAYSIANMAGDIERVQRTKDRA